MKIGIPTWKTGDNSIGITVPYYSFFQQFGDIYLLNVENDIDPTLDLLVLTGGPDIDPSRYSRYPSIFTGNPCPRRESFDLYKLPEYIEAEVPIFGVCRGLQTLAVHFNASLTQHISHVYSRDRDTLVHSIVIDSTVSNTSGNAGVLNLVRKVGTKGYKVNSMHHQAVSSNEFGDMRILAKDGTGRIIEAMYHPDLPIVAVQWHPEEIFDDFSEAIIRKLIQTKQPLNRW